MSHLQAELLRLGESAEKILKAVLKRMQVEPARLDITKLRNAIDTRIPKSRTRKDVDELVTQLEASGVYKPALVKDGDKRLSHYHLGILADATHGIMAKRPERVFQQDEELVDGRRREYVLVDGWEFVASKPKGTRIERPKTPGMNAAEILDSISELSVLGGSNTLVLYQVSTTPGNSNTFAYLAPSKTFAH